MKRASILVIGDPGPVRNDLLMRGDLEMLWMSNLDDAIAVLREATPSICLIGPEIPAAGARQLLLVASSKQLACLLLVDPRQRSPIVPSIAAHAAAVIPVGQIESVLALVGFHTGLTFARDARATIEAPVRVVIGRTEYRVETTNLSVSGVAINGLPKQPAGTPARLEIDLSFGTVTARARVVRWANEGKKQIAGLAFTEISIADRERISKLVECARREAPASQLRVSELFDDLTLDCEAQPALCTNDLNASIDLPHAEALLDVRPEYVQLERWATTEVFDRNAPQWLQAVAADLTQIEGVALVKGTVPDWVRPAIMMRLCLARSRHQCGEGRLPSVVSSGAYRTFVWLATVANGAQAGVVAQIAKIRASLLRDLLGTHRMVRAGAGAVPAPGPLAQTQSPAPSARNDRVRG